MLNAVKHLANVSWKKELLGETKVKGLQAALLGEAEASFVADQCSSRIGIATDAIIPRRPSAGSLTSAPSGIDLKVHDVQDDRDL